MAKTALGRGAVVGQAMVGGGSGEDRAVKVSVVQARSWTACNVHACRIWVGEAGSTLPRAVGELS